MSDSLTERLNQMLPRVTSPAFLSGQGIGNEIACYIFDYPATDELKVREHVEFMMDRFDKHHSDLRVLHLDLFDVVIGYLKKRGLFDKVLKMQEAKGGSAALRSLKGPLAAEKIRDFMAEEYHLEDQDLLLLSGVGSVCLANAARAWPPQLSPYGHGTGAAGDVLPRHFRRNDAHALRSNHRRWSRTRHETLLPSLHFGTTRDAVMKIQDLFERDIFRPINGVVKADQLDASSVWQELDEFVVTKELTRHFDTLISTLLSTIDSEADVAEKNGIWVSGFFGCGKSHLIKVLSYLLENEEHEYEGQRRHAVKFFEDKFDDSMLYADLKKVVATAMDTILFNIDSKADHRDGRDALLQVFLKVLNEKQEYSGDHPHIAHMERYLDEEGKLQVFHEAYERAAGSPWLTDRDAWEFHRDEVVAALTETLGQSEASIEKWVDGAEDNFPLTVENFAKWVKQYLDGKGGWVNRCVNVSGGVLPLLV